MASRESGQRLFRTIVPTYNQTYVNTKAWKVVMENEIRSASEVRNRWSDTLDEVEQGVTVTVTRRDHEPATIVNRRRYLALVERVQELEDLVEVYEILSDPEVREGLAEAEAQIERGEGLSFEEAFGEKP